MPPQPTILADVADEKPAILDAASGDVVTYGDLRATASDLAGRGFGLAVLRAENTAAAIAAYASVIESGIPILIIDRDVEPDALERYLETYRPDLVINAGVPDGFAALEPSPFPGLVAATSDHRTPTHPDLALLLSTSGSTGSPKLVRLSRTAVRSNATAIVESLGIRESDLTITSLPFSYTYGLSVINSHLVAGALVLATEASVVTSEFWELVESREVVSFAGVPSTYTMLRRMRWTPERYPSLRYVTQAGGRLSDPDRQHFIDLFEAGGRQFFVMYGQTEATARMTVAQPEDLRRILSTAGRALTGGSIEIVDPDESGSGSVVYSGPNVMLGYAESAEDLARGDDMQGRLVTGDLGYLDRDLLVLTGRTKRLVKVFGKRVSLDDVDAWLAERLEAQAIAVQGEDVIVIFVVGAEEDLAPIRRDLASYLGVHPTGVVFSSIDQVPLMSSGKVDLQLLGQWARENRR